MLWNRMLRTEVSRTLPMAGDGLAGLLGRAAAGDQAAFAALYERSAGRLFAIVLRIVRDPATAEAVLQQAFAGIWERAREFDSAQGDALAFMIAITRACAIDAVRSRPRDLNLQPGETVFDGLDGRIALSGLRRCLGEIEEPARRAVLLAYRDGLSYDELGAVLGMPADAARGLVGSALARMRQCLDDA
jgi:RNA polymerase sigma-70 factor (ECF subfamily)